MHKRDREREEEREKERKRERGGGKRKNEKENWLGLHLAIHPSDGDVKPAFREEQTVSRHLVSHSSFLSSSSHTAQLLYTNSYTYSHPNLNFLQYTIHILIPHVMWSAQVVRDSPSIRLARNPKRVIVQWVGIGTHTLLYNIYRTVNQAHVN